jgi:endonuclease-3
MSDNRPAEILKILRKIFTIPELTARTRDPFKTLITTIISQNTADRNTTRAFENLSKRFEIRPEVLAKAETEQIEECLKVAGLYRNKARVIKQVSKTILEEFHGEMDSILSLPHGEARKTLMKLRGVGPKTADVVLLFSANKPTIPVDTHVNRVSKRLGLVPSRGDYESVRKSLESLFDPKDYLAVHVLLIQHGRRYCKARNPLCKQCPLNVLCPSACLSEKE